MTGLGPASEAVGCVAIRPLTKEGSCGGSGDGAAPAAPARVCEMKRLWVGPGGRGSGLGRRLVVAAVAAARELGYKSVVLDTLQRLEAANKIYESSGFRRREPYYHNPLQNVVFWELDL
ncbi:hypothetical protein MNEG_6739 [Monoraphidium neglectum]|uniref:N-acetyltransferase domain-containing protein n=1 Tax=Monoraphidium neglectum TaxID=145388 RepID=A0A0D2L1M2_9CHLO|nr:hypothetical protein MNEG_6739 [Monoraphidium neglectum]KIZ01224.1 hypothetical protein MNEG_6739 [Monoraphidium neglectum]|eukprot:XP_013900243.1 hypothetical protein MNEG_6739 [Monoraphidium neglectum]